MGQTPLTIMWQMRGAPGTWADFAAGVLLRGGIVLLRGGIGLPRGGIGCLVARTLGGGIGGWEDLLGRDRYLLGTC